MIENTFYNKAINERQRLDREILSIQDEISELPEGKLVCSHNGNYIKWYQSDGRHATYISKKNKNLAEQLAIKKYLSTQLEELRHERKAINFYLRHHAGGESKVEQLLCEKSPYSVLLSTHFAPSSQKFHNWMTEPYEHNEAYPEQCIYKAGTGHLVRSKSEALVAMLLHVYRIPFRYECALFLGETVVYPDFTILHPQTGQVFYWEHFGMMDNPGYCKNAMAKLQLYASNGIIPSVQLLTTYESKEHPLDAGVAESMIRYYFL